MDIILTTIFEKVEEGYIGFVPELPGANTQGDTLEEAKANLTEAISLTLAANRELGEESLGDREVIRHIVSLHGS